MFHPLSHPTSSWSLLVYFPRSQDIIENIYLPLSVWNIRVWEDSKLCQSSETVSREQSVQFMFRQNVQNIDHILFISCIIMPFCVMLSLQISILQIILKLQTQTIKCQHETNCIRYSPQCEDCIHCNEAQVNAGKIVCDRFSFCAQTLEHIL